MSSLDTLANLQIVAKQRRRIVADDLAQEVTPVAVVQRAGAERLPRAAVDTGALGNGIAGEKKDGESDEVLCVRYLVSTDSSLRSGISRRTFILAGLQKEGGFSKPC
jgi:hypothetical protein